jgi:hypothetical protein
MVNTDELFGGEDKLNAVSNGFDLFKVIALGPFEAFMESTGFTL